MTSYADRLHSQVQQRKTSALVGLDPRWDLLPAEIRNSAAASGSDSRTIQAHGFQTFCCELIDIVAPLVPAVKPQVAFFEQLGPAGMMALEAVMQHARKAGLIVIADAKRGDIGSTAAAYASAWLAGSDPSAAAFPADALTVNAYLGMDTLQPFIDAAIERSAGLYVLVRTSNPGAGTLQDHSNGTQKLFETLADMLQQINQQHWPDAKYGSVGAVVGATWPAELQALRGAMTAVPLLVPGYGSQGGTAEDVAAAFDADGLGALINSSRGINFAYRQSPWTDQFAPHQWRDAIAAATHQMIADLRQHTPAIK